MTPGYASSIFFRASSIFYVKLQSVPGTPGPASPKVCFVLVFVKFHSVSFRFTWLRKKQNEAENESDMWEAYSRKVKDEKKTARYWAAQNEKHWSDVHYNGYGSSQYKSPYRYGETSYSSYYYH